MDPAMKSATTASTGTPPPAMKIPVCPVARKSAFHPRPLISFSIASDVYILPTEQSVPTVSNLWPERRSPVAMGYDSMGVRASYRERPRRVAASRISVIESRRVCKPLAMSMPCSRAASIAPRQFSGMTPPRLATPISRVRAPRRAASATSRSSMPRSTAHPGRRNCPIHASGRQSYTPIAVLPAGRSGASPRNRR